jgi:hypothetical protein
MNKKVFFVSDSTGITVQTLGESLLSQFDHLQVQTEVIPYVNSAEKAASTVEYINRYVNAGQNQALVFETLADSSIKQVLADAQAEIVDVLATFTSPLERFLQSQSSVRMGKDPKKIEHESYKSRIDAVHFALENDDGARLTQYDQADVILLGVSRSGKTPSCLYMAMQFGIYAANYPITEEDMEHNRLPKSLQAHRNKLFGLTIDPRRLSAIRHERKANSRYASLQQCEFEVGTVEQLYRRFKIPYIDATQHSIEEIATKILDQTGMRRHR